MKRFSGVQTQYYFLITIFTSAIFILDLFYSILIFKDTHDIRFIILNFIIANTVNLIAYTIGSAILARTSFSFTTRISFIFMTLTGLFGFFFLGKIFNFYILFSIFRGISEGFYWVPTNLIALDGINKYSRSKIFSILNGSGTILSIVVPVLLGLFLSNTNDYKIIFILFAGVSSLGIIFPWHFEKLENISFKISNFGKIISHPDFFSFINIKAATASVWMLSGISGSLIPYIILKSEADVGILITISALFGAIIAFLTRNIKLKQKREIGFFSAFLKLGVDILLGLNLYPLFLYLNKLLDNLLAPALIPAEEELSLNVTDKFEIRNHISIELCLLREVIYYLSGLAFGLVFIFMSSYNLSSKTLLAITLVTGGIVRFLAYTGMWKFSTKHRI